jgi:hypothetical protein
MPACPRGHESSTADYCETCGAPIRGTAPPDSVQSKPSFRTQIVVPDGPDREPNRCPRCTTPRLPGARFCEVDGYDFDADAPAIPAAWAFEVAADREYYARCAPAGVEFPNGYPSRRFQFDGDDAAIGRRSETRHVNPEIDLAGSVEDPAVSRLHARFVREADGSLAVVDAGSTNGTRLNGGDEPIRPGEHVPLADGDRVHIGAWTTITVRRR